MQNDSAYFYAVSAVTGYGEGQQCAAVSALAEWNDMDHNGDGVVDMRDFALFGVEWLWEAGWHEP